MSGSQQQLFLIVSRFDLNPQLIPPFKIILPTLQLISPVRIFTSMQKQITLINKNTGILFGSLYQSLAYHLQNQEGQINMNDTFNMIYNQKLNQEYQNKKKNQNKDPWKFRICLIGEQIISWDIVMNYKLKNIVIDTIGQNKRLQQISFATGGINRKFTFNQNIVKLFMTIFSLSTESRKKFNLLYLSREDQSSSRSIQFTVDCVCCKPQSKELSNQCYLCSKCLAVHCSRINETCYECGSIMEDIPLKHKPC